jgi:hypothetical protein
LLAAVVAAAAFVVEEVFTEAACAPPMSEVAPPTPDVRVVIE